MTGEWEYGYKDGKIFIHPKDVETIAKVHEFGKIEAKVYEFGKIETYNLNDVATFYVKGIARYGLINRKREIIVFPVFKHCYINTHLKKHSCR